MIQEFVVSNPAVPEGELLFHGTNVPVQALIEYRKGEVPVYEFLIDHPAVQPQHAKKFARWLAGMDQAAARAQLEQLRQSRPEGRPG